MRLSRTDIERAVRDRRDWAVETLSDMVRQPTVLGQEEGGQEHLAGVMESLGMAVRFEPIRLEDIRDLPGFSPVDWKLEGKKNLVGHAEAGRGQRKLVFNGHIDVVSPEPVELWTSDPYAPRLEEIDGEPWLFGRGAGDMKGGTVAYLWALAALRDAGLRPAGQVICQSPVEEECTGNGTLALLAQGYGGDAAVIPEPFDETILTHQVGVVWFRVKVLGKPTHVLGAGRGHNAIERSVPIIRALRALEAEHNQPERIPEPYRGVDNPLNLNVGIIEGGDWASTVAGACTTHFRFGLFPGEDLAALRRVVEARVAEAAAEDPWLRDCPPKVEWVGFQAEGCACSLHGDLGHELSGAHEAWRGAPPRPLASTATTDVRFFERYYGTPATCYGPRAVDIHGVDERVSVDSVQRVAEVLTEFVQRFVGVERRTRS